MSGIDRATAQWYVDTALAKLLARADELVDADLVVSSLADVVFEVVDGRVRVHPRQP